MHEDILYRTEDWGEKIITHFEDITIGLLGFAGTHFLPSVPTYWLKSPFISEYNLTNDNGIIIECKKEEFFNEDNIADVVACDGFCFFIRKSLFDKIEFDETLFGGFHFYDMDICMQVLKAEYKVAVCRNILIEHEWSEKSMLNGMDVFYKNQNIFFNKWKEWFPISKGIDHIPVYSLERINRLYHEAYDAKKVRNSKAYRLGKFILSPLKKLKY